MNFEKIKKLNDELNQIEDVTERLDHYRYEYLEKYPGKLLWEYFEMVSASEQNKSLGDAFDGKYFKIPINENKLVPVLHPPTNAVPLKQRIEYYHWMLYFLAEQRFKQITKPALEKELNSPLGEQILIGKLNKIIKTRKNALSALTDGRIKIEGGKLTDEKLYLWYADDYYSREEIPITVMENPYVESVCEHKYEYPHIKNLLKEDEKKNRKKEILKLIGIDIPRLVLELVKRKYVDKHEEVILQNWFKGIVPAEPIYINKPMSHFASLIADLQEEGFIKNKKTFCKNLIHNTLRFNNEVKSPASIKNALNENSYSRLQKSDVDNYIDFKDFIIKQ